jgi:NAD(P)-dependent dehydrogenase (short-subunit alcohol dehydrogenase family)
MERLTDKVVLLAGGGGISSGVALRLASEGPRLAIGDVRPEAVHTVVDKITAEGGSAIALKLDIADEASVAGFVADAVSHYRGATRCSTSQPTPHPHDHGGRRRRSERLA